MDARIGINQDAFGSQTLGTVAGDGVTVIEMAVLAWIEFKLAVVFKAG